MNRKLKGLVTMPSNKNNYKKEMEDRSKHMRKWI